MIALHSPAAASFNFFYRIPPLEVTAPDNLSSPPPHTHFLPPSTVCDKILFCRSTSVCLCERKREKVLCLKKPKMQHFYRSASQTTDFQAHFPLKQDKELHECARAAVVSGVEVPSRLGQGHVSAVMRGAAGSMCWNVSENTHTHTGAHKFQSTLGAKISLILF